MPRNGAISCAWRECQADRDLWGGPRGATPAFPGQRVAVSSMRDDAVILEAVESPKAAWSFYSKVHGAGRLFGRKDAERQLWRAEMNAWIRCRGVMLIGADFDESSKAYRRLPDVLPAHASAVKILYRMGNIRCIRCHRGGGGR